MVGHADLSGQHGPAADLARARHAHLADQDHVLTDIAVVAYLHEVVDLRAAPHNGRAHGGAVDGGVRSDLDIVLDDEPSHLRDLLVGGSVERIAESVGAQHGAGMDDDAITEAYPVSHHDARVQPHVGAEHGAPPDIAEGAHGGARPDHGVALDHGPRGHRGRGIHVRAGGHAGRGVHTWLEGRLGMEEPQESDQGRLG